MGVFDNIIGLFRSDAPGPLPVALPQVQDDFKSDDWANIKTSQGTSYDKKTWSVPFDRILSVGMLDTMYQSSDITARIVDIPPDEMLRQGYTIVFENDDQDDSQMHDFMEELERHCVNDKVTLCGKWDRLFGGGAIFFGVNDGLDPSDELDLTKIRSVDYLTVLDRYELISSGLIDTDVGSPNFGKPLYYTLATIDTKMAGVRIHWSRIVRFDGIRMSRRREMALGYWGQSLVNRIFNIIQNYETSNDAVASLIQDFNTIVFKMQELQTIQAGSPQGKKLLQERLNMALQLNSILNALIIRSGEEIEYKTRNVTGLADCMNGVVDRLVVASEVPRILLLGESPKGGVGSNGENEVRIFYDHIKTKQKNTLTAKLRRIIQIFMAAKMGVYKGQIKPFEIKYNPLWQQTDLELSETRMNTASADEKYAQMQAFSPEEIAESRSVSMGITMNASLRARMKAEAPEEAKSLEGEEDDDPPSTLSRSMGKVASTAGAQPTKPVK